MKTKMKNPNSNICAGQFLAGEVKAGVFCGGEIEPGTFHKSLENTDLGKAASRHDSEGEAKEGDSGSEVSTEAETSSGNGESQD